jgi:REP element-mobilizing transposase RayT
MYVGPDRKTMRYRGHDYRAPCCVHVTICTHHRQPLFGRVTADGMVLNNAGHLVDRALRAIHDDAKGIAIEPYIIMPDHVHAVITLGTHPLADPGRSVSDVVRDVKTIVQRSWPGGIKRAEWPPYEGHLWQLSFYDTIIRSDRQLEATRAYILENPARWLARHRDG